MEILKLLAAIVGGLAVPVAVYYFAYWFVGYGLDGFDKNRPWQKSARAYTREGSKEAIEWNFIEYTRKRKA